VCERLINYLFCSPRKRYVIPVAMEKIPSSVIIYACKREFFLFHEGRAADIPPSLGYFSPPISQCSITHLPPYHVLSLRVYQVRVVVLVNLQQMRWYPLPSRVSGLMGKAAYSLRGQAYRRVRMKECRIRLDGYGADWTHWTVFSCCFGPFLGASTCGRGTCHRRTRYFNRKRFASHNESSFSFYPSLFRALFLKLIQVPRETCFLRRIYSHQLKIVLPRPI
jgi:hypothetical protein